MNFSKLGIGMAGELVPCFRSPKLIPSWNWFWAFALFLLPLSVEAQLQANSPWPKFHANAQNTGVGADSSTTGTEKWSFSTHGYIESSPAVAADGTVYVGSEDGYLYAFDGSTGAEKWAFGAAHGFESAPAIGSDGTVYIGANDGNVYAMNGSNGAKKWSFTTGDVVRSSPTIATDGTVYVGSEDGNVYALNGATGAQKWYFATGDSVDSSPAIASSGTIYVGSEDDNVYALNGATGAQIWSFAGDAPFYSSPAVGSDGTIYIGCDDGNLYAIDDSTGSQKWALAAGNVLYPSPAIGADGTVYISSDSGYLYAVGGSTGVKKWSYQIGTYGANSSPAVGQDGTIYIGSDDSNLYAIKSDGTKKWSFATAGVVNSSPAIGADGTIFVGSEDEKLYAFGTTTISNFYISPATGVGGYSPRGVVQLSGVGASGGDQVSLASASADVTVPTSVVVPAGLSGVSFAISTSVVSSEETVTLTATFGSSVDHTTITLNPAPPSKIYTSPSTVVGGHSTYGVVQLSSKAGPNGNVISLASNNPNATVPTTVKVPAGSTGVSFLISTTAISTQETVTITAAEGAASVHTTVPLTINPAGISDFYFSPATVTEGHGAYGVVQLAGPAGANGNIVALLSGNSAVSVPASVTVPDGKTGVSFLITADAVSTPTSVSVTATESSTATGSSGAFSSSKPTSVTVNPAPFSNFYVSPSSVKGGATTYGVVQLSGPAGSSGDVVSLSTGDSHAVVPATVTIPAGKKGVSFAITTNAVSATVQVTLTATFNGGSKPTTLTLDP